MHEQAKQAKLYIIGAGPGDPDLLTLQAARALRECDVVLYDRLVTRDVLALSREDAERIYVGKHEGEQETAQQYIFHLIRDHAMLGRRIGRLKGGDPLVFGRGAEEWEAAVKLGIQVELVPGISSALAVPALAGIPLTYRGISQSFAVVTAHCHEGRSEHWDRFAHLDTLVVLMGVKNRAFIARSLMDAGRAATEPVAFIENGTTVRERVVESTLEQVAAGEVEVESPAVFVVGQVVRLRERLITAGESRELPVPAVRE